MKRAFFALLSLFLLFPLAYSSYEFNPGPEWTLEWSDEFNGTTLDTNNWGYELGFGDIPDKNVWGWGVGGIQDYTSSVSNVFVTNGNLVLRAIYNGGALNGRNFTSGKIFTRDKRSFLFGLIAARIKMPSGNGTFPAFWMLGTNGYFTNDSWPGCGEIDIVELFNGGKTANVASHWYDEVLKTPYGKSSSTSHETRLSNDAPYSDEYHVFELIWTPVKLRWKIDGKTVLLQSIRPDVYSELRAPMFLILNNGIGSWFEKVGYPDTTTVFPQDMMVDWVRVYRSNESAEQK